jgi:hypothetical protein
MSDEIESECNRAINEHTFFVAVETWRYIYRGETLPITSFNSAQYEQRETVEPTRYQFRP